MSSKSRAGRLARNFIANIGRSSATTISTSPTRDAGTPSWILERAYELLRREIASVFGKPSAMRDPSRRNSSSVDRRRVSRNSSNERSAESLLLPGLGTGPDATVRRSTHGRHGAEPRTGTTLTWNVSPIDSTTGVPQLRPNALVEVEGCPTAKDGETLWRGYVPGDLAIAISL
jgi:hypothetical protein